MSVYKGKLAIVTGGTSGIGFAIAQHFLKHGATVVVAGSNADKGQKAEKELGERAIFCQTNIASWESQCTLFERARAISPNGRVDFVLANAGIAQMTQLRSSDPRHFATSDLALEELKGNPPDLSVINVNTIGTLYTVQLALAYFRAQKPDETGWRGKIVVTASNASWYCFPNDPLYAVTKSGHIGMIRALGPKVLPEAITINAMGPSVVKTLIGPKELFDKLEKEDRLTPMQTVLDCVDMLLDPKCRLTGQIVENFKDQNILRALPKYLNESVKKNMDEFHPVEQSDDALQTYGYPVF